MSITYSNSINTKPSTIKDGIYDSTTSSIIVVEDTGPTWRRYSTLSELASATCVSGPSSVTLINSLSSVVGSYNNSTFDFFENASGYRTNISGGITQSEFKNQASAGDTTNGVVIMVNNTKTIAVINSNQTVTQVTPPGYGTTDIYSCVILMSPGNFFIAGRFGRVYQISDTGVILDQLTVTLPNTGILQNSDISALSVNQIYSLSYDNNLLLVSSEHGLSLWDWTTKTNLGQWGNHYPGDSWASVLCASSSGETLHAWTQTLITEDNTIRETDFTVQPIYTRDNLFTGSTNPISSLGFCPGAGFAFALQQTSERIVIFSVTPRATTTRTVTLPAGFTQSRLIWLDDTNGIGTIQVLLDTIMNSPGTYRIPTGRSIIEIVISGYGTSAFCGVSRYST